jgi:heterodisulfide reductase subunit A-like polyferredoxin
MAQLEKAFPTNDCSTGILASAKIECSSHEHVQFLTYSDVAEVSGGVGHSLGLYAARWPRMLRQRHRGVVRVPEVVE